MSARGRIAAVALACGVVAAFASSGYAQPPREAGMSSARESAVHECSVANAKYHGSWQGHQTARYRACMFEHGETE
jgi:hypothetical protein